MSNIKAKKAIVNFGLNLLLDAFKMNERGEEQVQTLPELADIAPVRAIKRKEGAVVMIIGARELGKSVAAYRLAQILERPTYAISPEESPPKWVTELKLNEIEDRPPPWSTLVFDDIPAYMGIHDYSDAFVRAVEHLIPVVRKKRKLILIFATQMASLADKYTLDADLILLKPANPLYADIERPAVKKLQDRAMPFWKNKSDHWVQRHCYVVHRLYEGLVRVDHYSHYIPREE